MEIQFIGAAQTVTGSLHLLKIEGKQYILDCGLIQGKRKESFELNKNFEYLDPAEIDSVILSHAHIDHCGNLPNLVKKGFKGNIYCTKATKDLTALLLRDCAHIQEKDIEFVNKKRAKQGKNLFEPIYDQNDVEETITHLVGVDYHEEFEVSQNLRVCFYDAGHILGSAIVYMSINENGKNINLGFSGDLGRPNLPILKDPERIPDVDYWISESTYGGRFHANINEVEGRLTEIVNKAISRNGKIIIPSFSVGRTQELVYALHKLFEKDNSLRIPIFVDSPLSTNATQIFREHPECFDDETNEFLQREEDPFGFNMLRYITDVEDSKKLNEIKQPVIIISSSGMAEAGRILHHLMNNIENPNNIILIVGYCAENTLGRHLVEKMEVVKIFGEEFNVKAEVIVLNSMSAHADSNELINYCADFNQEKLKKIFLVHGDKDQQEKYKTRLGNIGYNNILIPAKGDIFSI
jgi:metallo-beta-lactamase family protein